MATVATIKARANRWPLYGELGLLAYDPIEDNVQCHICGRWFRGLGQHIRAQHGWSPDDYREEFELNRTQALMPESTRERIGSINRELGLWKNLTSHTMTEAELKQFLANIKPRSGQKLRLQTLIPRSERLRLYNPMNEPEARERALAKQRQSWYGSERMKNVCRTNLLMTIAKLRERNLVENRWVCPCGQAFATREELREHRRDCVTHVEEITQ